MFRNIMGMILILVFTVLGADLMVSLNAAVKAKDSVAVLSILNRGVDVSKLGSDGSHPLFVAVAEGDLAIARILIKHGSSVNMRHSMGGTVLAAAIRGSQDVAMVQLLIDHGVDLRMPNRTVFDPVGVLPVDIAAGSGLVDIVGLIKKHSPISALEQVQVDLLLKKALSNRTMIIGTLTKIEKGFIEVSRMGGIYRFPIQSGTRLLDKDFKAIDLSVFKEGKLVTVYLNGMLVCEIVYGSMVTISK